MLAEQHHQWVFGPLVGILLHPCFDISVRPVTSEKETLFQARNNTSPGQENPLNHSQVHAESPTVQLYVVAFCKTNCRSISRPEALCKEWQSDCAICALDGWDIDGAIDGSHIAVTITKIH